MKKLIVNADDFGLTKEISDEIIKIFFLGNISSTSLMANTPELIMQLNWQKETQN